MQKHTFFLFALILVAAIACTKKDASDAGFKLGTPFSLKQGETSPWEGSDAVQVRFDRVVEDSRCPTDVVCVWAGRAEVELTFTHPGGTQTDILVLGETAGTDKTDQAVFGAYTVQLIKVLPDALSTVEIPQAQYTVELVVRKN